MKQVKFQQKFLTIKSSYELQQESLPQKDVRDHIQSTIKKNNKQYLEKVRKSPSKNPLAIKTSSPIRLTDLIRDKEHRKKPYDKE